MSYATRRKAILATLEDIKGIGAVFDHKRHVNDWTTFLERFVTNGRVNVTWFTLVAANESGDDPEATTTEADLLEISARSETWRIEFFFGFKDDDHEPSEFAFQELCERIEDTFRFMQNLDGLADVHKSFPLQRVASDVFYFLGGESLVHRAEFLLTLKVRIENT